MKTIIYVYTGTGNSLWAARSLADELGTTEIRSIAHFEQYEDHVTADAVGFVFPVHIWGLPRKVVSFVNNMPLLSSTYYFAVAMNAGQVAATLIQLQKMLQSRGARLSAGFEICMPNNYIPWGGPGAKEAVQKRLSDATKKIKEIAVVFKEKKVEKPEKGPSWKNVLYSLFYKFLIKKVPDLDKNFWSDDSCNSCGICVKICPAGNIELQDGRPRWLHHCEQCMACIHWCSRESIQYGSRTKNYQRYHHPQINMQDILSLVTKQK